MESPEKGRLRFAIQGPQNRVKGVWARGVKGGWGSGEWSGGVWSNGGIFIPLENSNWVRSTIAGTKIGGTAMA